LGKGPASGAFPISLAIHKPGPFEPGSEQQLAVTAMMSDGSTANITHKVTWSSSDEAIVKVLPGGRVKILGAGPVKITATAPGGKPSTSIDVKAQAPLQRIEVTPANPLLLIGQDSEIMVATGIYADGSTDDIRFSVKWSSDNPKVADFPGQGNGCLGKAKGTATVWATSPDGKVSGFTKVTVAAAGKAPTLSEIKIEPLNPEIKNGVPVQFKAMGVYSDKSTHEITGKVTWESAEPDVLAIDNWGLAKPRLQSGSALIRTSDPVTHRFKSTTCYVEFPGIRSIDLSPKTVHVRRGDGASVTVMANLHGGWQMSLNDIVTFTPANRDVAVMTAGGEMVVGEGAGTTTIKVAEASTNWSGVIDVTVLPPELAEIVVLPPGPQTIRVGQTLKFEASGMFSDSTLVPRDGPTWRSSSPDVIDVDSSGLATARKPGDAFIRVVDRDTSIMVSVEVKAVP